MADPQAVMRAASSKPPMGGMPDTPPAGPAPSGPAAAPPDAGGLDTMVQNLQGVGEFLKSKGPAAQEAMGHFQALLQSMGKIGSGDAPAAPAAPAAPSAPEAPKGNGRIHESQQPGVQVL